MHSEGIYHNDQQPDIVYNGLLAWLGMIGDFEHAHDVFETIITTSKWVWRWVGPGICHIVFMNYTMVILLAKQIQSDKHGWSIIIDIIIIRRLKRTLKHSTERVLLFKVESTPKWRLETPVE